MKQSGWGLVTKCFLENAEELCNRFDLFIQKTQSGKDANKIHDEIGDITNKLLSIYFLLKDNTKDFWSVLY